MWKKILAAVLVIVAAATLIVWLTTEDKNQPEKIYKIGIVKEPPSLEPAMKGFRSEMQALGYEEGVNLEYIQTEPRADDAVLTEQRLKELIEKQVDLIVVMGVREARAAKSATEKFAPSLPVVFGVVSDPVGSGVVNSIQSSGNNLAGVTPANEILVTKRAEVMLSLVPSTKRLVTAWNNPNTSGVANLREAAKKLNVELVEKQVKTVAELDNFLATFKPQPGDAYLRATDTTSAERVKEIIAWGLKNKIPVGGTNIVDAERGAFMSYGADYETIGFQVARLADKILKGATPSDLPIEPPGKVELIVNSKTADALGITISQSAAISVNKFIR